MSQSVKTEAKALETALQAFHARFQTDVIKREFDSFGFELVIQNRIAGVMFKRVPREGDGWIVMVARLRGGVFPEYPIFITPKSRLDQFDIRDIATLRGGLIPSLKEKIAKDMPLSAVDVVDLLNTCCVDLLTGDFSLFRNLDLLVKKRAATNR